MGRGPGVLLRLRWRSAIAWARGRLGPGLLRQGVPWFAWANSRWWALIKLELAQRGALAAGRASSAWWWSLWWPSVMLLMLFAVALNVDFCCPPFLSVS